MNALRAAAVLALLVAAPARASGESTVPVAVGGTANVCKLGIVLCPVVSFMCDDPKIAVIVNGKEGAEIHGKSAGTTLCAVIGPNRFRTFFRVNVTGE